MKKGIISYCAGLLIFGITFSVTGGDCIQWKECWVFFLLSSILLGMGLLQSVCSKMINKQLPVKELYFLALMLLLFGTQRPVDAALVMAAYGVVYYLFAVSRHHFGKKMDQIPEWFPKTACCITGQGEETTPVKNVEPGQKIIVRKGETIPLDGIVSLGTATIDKRLISGELMPKTVSIGEEIYAGSINLEDEIEIRVTKSFNNTAMIMDFYEIRKEQNERILIQNYRDKSYGIYLLAIVLVGMLIMVGVPYSVAHAKWGEWIIRGGAFLIAAQPFGLAYSYVLTDYSGAEKALQRGILIKHGKSLKTLAETNIFYFKKMGVLTTGVLTVRRIMSMEMMDQELLELAAHLSTGMVKPLSDALAEAYHGTVRKNEVSDLESIPGCGISGVYQNEKITIGNSQLVRKAGLPEEIVWDQDVVLYVFKEDKYAGYIQLKEEPMEEAAPLLRKMKEKCRAVYIMMTSGLDERAHQIMERFSIDQMYPANDEEEELETLTDYVYTLDDTEKMAFVSTSGRDKNLFSIADVGIMIGNLTQGVKIKSADIIILTEMIEGLPTLVRMAKEMANIKKQNRHIAEITKVLEIALVIAGLVTIKQIIIVEAVSTVLIILNGLWVKRYADY